MPAEGMTVAQIRQEARESAAEILTTHWNGVLPVDPVKLARDLGVSVFDAQLGDDTFGMIIGSAGGADIYLDEDQPPTRYRFSCAHELGHYVDRKDQLAPHTGYVDKRSDDGRGRPEEIWANEFAASILMPETDFRAHMSQRFNDVQLASRYGVSLASASYRRTLLLAS